MRPVDWQELVKLCEDEGCHYDRTKGDHIAMVRPGMFRPAIIPKKADLTEDIVFGIAKTIGISKKVLREKLYGQTKKPQKMKIASKAQTFESSDTSIQRDPESPDSDPA